MSGPTLVSVIIPAYNVAPYIREALESVLAQHYLAYEVLVVNDGSPDTPALEDALAPYRKRIRYLTQPNRGVAAARNTAIAASRGLLLAFLDADDLWAPAFLESQVAYLEQGGFDMVYADATLFGDVARPGRTFMEISPSRGAADLEGLLSANCQPVTSTTIARKQAVVEAGLFDENMRRGQDFDLWVRLAFQGAKIGYQRAVLGSYRLRGDSLSGNAIQNIGRQLNVYQTLGRKLALPPRAAGMVEGWIHRLTAMRELEVGKAELVAGNYARAAGLFKSAWREQPSLQLLGARLAVAAAPRLLRWAYLRLRSP